MLTDPTSGGGYSFGQTLPSADATSIALQLPFALDGDAGGTYTPSNPLVIGGITLDGNNLLSAGSITVDFTVVGDVVQGTSTLISLGSFLSVGTSTFTGTATFNGAADFQDGLHVGGSGVVLIERAVTLSSAAPVEFQGTAQFDQGAKIEGELDFSVLGTVRERVTYGTDANATLTYGTVGQIHIFPTTMSTTRTIKLGDAPHEGNRLRLVNLSGSTQTIQNSGGGSILLAPGPLPAVASFVPGVMDLVWANAGSYVGWIQVGQ
jgi:hypothetical protein